MTEYRRLKKIPANEYGDSGELDKYDTEKIESHGFDLVLYWYAYGSYEGSGEMLARRDGRWAYANLGHCSCYGPVDNLGPFSWWNSIAELMASCTPYARTSIEPLLALLKDGES